MEENEAVSNKTVLDGSSDGKAQLDTSEQPTDLAEEAKAELVSSNQPDLLEDNVVTKSDVDLSENTNGNCATNDSEVSKQSSDIENVDNSETAKSLQNHVTEDEQGDSEVSDNDKLGQDSISTIANDEENNDNNDTAMEVDGPDKCAEIVAQNEIEENNVENEIKDSEVINQSNEIEEFTEIEKSKENDDSKAIEDPKETEKLEELEEPKEMEVSEESKDQDYSKEEYENNTQSTNVDIDEEESSSGKPEERDGKDVDPFDALLKDTSENETESVLTSRQNVTNIVDADDEDDDHQDADDGHHVADDGHHDTDDGHHDVDNGCHDADDGCHDADDGHHDADYGLDNIDDETECIQTDDPAIEDEPGAYEEVCLLPDTEREISDADKAEAAKVLAEKRKQAEELATTTLIAKEEKQMEVDETSEVNDINNDENSESVADAANEATPEDNADKETEMDEDRPNPGIINEINPVDEMCAECLKYKTCIYKLNIDNETRHICGEICIVKFQRDHPDQYIVVDKKFVIIEIAPIQQICSECEEHKVCYFYYNYDGEDTSYCSLKCLHSMMADEKEKYVFKRRKITVLETDPVRETCERCEATKNCTLKFSRYDETHYLCSMPCLKSLNDAEDNRYGFKAKKTTKLSTTTTPMLKLKVISNATDKYLDEAYKIQAKTPAMIQAAKEDRERTFTRHCMHCSLVLSLDDKNLTWETMEFCNEVCLGRYQNKIGSRCTNCSDIVNHTSLGKYCVRFGYDIRQFCNSSCLEEFKKGLKICCYCQKDLSAGHQGFLAPVGDKGQFKDFCSQNCMERFDQMSKNPVPQPVWAKCAVCSIDKPTTIEIEVDENVTQRLCSEPCLAAYKFVNSVFPDQCNWCKKFFERKPSSNFTIYDGATPHCFCTKSCLNVYISNSRHIVPCNWCKVKKYNFDMIKKNIPNGQSVMMCSLNCLNLYQVSVNAVSFKRIQCDMCKTMSQAHYHLTMSDATVRNFCTYQCVMAFQAQYSMSTQLLPGEQAQAIESSKAFPTGAPTKTYASGTTYNKANAMKQKRSASGLPVISNVQSLATPPPLVPTSTHGTRGKSKRLAQQLSPPEPEPPQTPKTPPPPPKPPTPPPPPPPVIYNHVLVKTLPPTEVSNKGTLTKPMMVSKGVSCRPHPCTKECQTDPSLERRVLIPIPVPIYVPVPCAMYSLPFPVPVPIPLPIPTPVFIPTTRNSAKGIMKEISKIHDKMPTDPFEAELLMMAEMVAGDKKKDQSDSETDDDNGPEEGFSPVPMDGNNAFGEDMLQMALKMATEYEEPAVDLESAMTANTITPSSHPGMPGLEGESMHHHHMMVLEQQRAVAALRASTAPRKRAPPAPTPPVTRRSSKRRRMESAPPPQPEPPREPAEKPDANMCLKYTFGVNAWKQWVMTKNAEIEKSSIRRKPFKSEILQLNSDELNYSLCLFVKEVRKPNGSEYAPDTIYYLVLGIQQYLFENGRIDNIFTDPYYEKFTDCLDEVARKFSVLYNDSQYIVTRVEEEHLWESKQLGAHSPHVLLSTLMFFNTKHFNLVTVDEHMQLSFSHIMKHWKRNPNQPGQAKLPGSRNVLLRFYPPQSALEANSRKKKVYEQQENEDNPLRCPVKLYEFYISKCPESVRTRNDVFYLQPERSCVPDSPVWYSTQPLSREALAKMLHRVKMVKEINIALLTS